MNIHQANAIPIVQILEKMGAKSVERKDADHWYLSPIRNDKIPNFYANADKNIWHDFGTDIGGDNIALVCAYLEYSNENYRVQDALRWLKNMLGFIRDITPVEVPDYSKQDSKLILRSTKPIEHIGLIKYLEKRGIPLDVASQYLEEVRVYNKESRTTFFTLGFKNETGGYELRNPTFKGSLRRKNVTFIRGRIPKPESINIFDDFTDYLSSIIDQKEEFEGDTIVLNSLLCMKKATAYIKNYGYRYAYTWLDNDEAGNQATASFAEFFQTEENLTHVPMNALYENYKDVNEWLVSKIKLD